VVNYAGRLVGIISREDVCINVPSRTPVVQNLWQAAWERGRDDVPQTVQSAELWRCSSQGSRL